MEPTPTIEQNFSRIFGIDPVVVATAPGRVNLLGDHTDYNDGFVFPAAIDRHVRIAAGPRQDTMLSLYSSHLHASAEFPTTQMRPNKELPWTNYVAGVYYGLQKQGVKLGGVNILIENTLPLGAGLSSSAALEVASAFALKSIYPFELSALEIIKLCQQAEYSFVGVHCGVMDQFVSALGKKDSALLIDCRSLEYEAVPLPPSTKLLICDTNVRRSLVDSEFNLRRVDCQMAAHKLANLISGVKALRDVSLEDLRKHKHALDSTLYRRANHVVTENARVLDSVEALRRGDLKEFGIQMYKSHFSLRYDFQVSCRELDAVVDICSTVGGVLGARMTGAGFGGCAICLVQEESVKDVTSALKEEYPRRTGLQPTIFVTTLEDGVNVKNLA